jgi:hypothetical protein
MGEVVLKALRKIVAALQGVGHEPVAIGALARQAWGSKKEAQAVELLIPTGPEHREAILSAARGEGLQMATGGPGTLHLRYTDAKLGGSANVELTEAATPFHKRLISRAQREPVLQVQMRLAACEDLILWSAGLTPPADRDTVIELLRATAGRLDAGYLKEEAESAGVFDVIKSAWQAAKQQA